MKCEEIKDLITLYVLGDLQPSQMNEIKMHLEQCEKCRIYTQQIQITIDLVKDALIQTSAVPHRLPETKRALIMRKQFAPCRRRSLWLSGQLMRLSVIASAAALLLFIFFMLPAKQEQILRSSPSPAQPQPGTKTTSKLDDIVFLDAKPRADKSPVLKTDSAKELKEGIPPPMSGVARRIVCMRKGPIEDKRIFAEKPFVGRLKNETGLESAEDYGKGGGERSVAGEVAQSDNKDYTDRANLPDAVPFRPAVSKAEAEKSAKVAREGSLVDFQPPARKSPPPQYFNPFVIPSIQPVSTFSIDVDTASYSMARNYILVKRLRPPPELVRTEEFVNYFDYDYRPPSSATFAIYVTGAPSKFKPDLHLLKIGIKGRRAGREQRRIAVLTCLIDTSGSMDQPDRIGMVKKALRILVERLDQSDRIAIVTFDTKVNVLLPYTNATEKEKILDAVDSIKCGGETNMGEGFRYAYQLAHEHFVPGAENRVVVMSDGMANLGHTEAEEILCTIKPYIECGIYCSIYGVGTKSYNDAMLQRLANKGNGVYAFIDSEAEARRLFVDELSASINTIASDVKIQVEFNPLMVERYRLMGYEKRQLKKEDFRDDAVDAGEVGSGQSATALYEVQLKSTKPIYPQNVIGNVIDLQRFSQIAVVRVRYKRLDTGAVEEIEQRISTADLVDNFDNADVYFRLASAVAEFAELLRNSPYAAPGGFEAVARVIERVAGELHWDGRVRELAELIHIAPTLSRGE